MLESCLAFRVKKGNDVRKHLLRNNVAIAMDDAADPSHSRTGCCSYAYTAEHRQKVVGKFARTCNRVGANWPF